MKSSKRIRSASDELADRAGSLEDRLHVEPGALSSTFSAPGSVLESLPIAIWEADVDTLELRYLNRRAAEVLGRDPCEPQAGLAERAPAWPRQAFGEHGALIEQLLRQVGSDGVARRIEHGGPARSRAPAGGDVDVDAKMTAEPWFETSVQVSRWSDGRPWALSGTTVDISDRRRADATARAALARDAIEQRAAAQRVAAQQMAARVLAEAASLPAAMGQILKNVGEALGWQYGGYWAALHRGTQLRCESVWAVEELAGSELCEMSRSFTLRAGEDLPGQVLATGEPVLAAGLGDGPGSPRWLAAGRAGLRGGAAFPVLHGREVLGVMEFLARDPGAPDEALLQMMAAIGSQVCQFMKRAWAQKAVQDSEARKAAIIASALDCVVSMDHEGRICDFNPAAERTFGWRAADVVGKPLCELLVPHRHRDRFREGLARYLTAGDASFVGRRMEGTALRSDGQEIPVEIAVTVTAADPPAFTGFLRDITERVRSFDGLRRSHDELSLILQGLSEGVTVRDASARLVFANDAAAITCGFESARQMLSPAIADEDMLARFEVFDEEGRPLARSDLPSPRALEGIPSERLVRFRNTLSEDDQDRWTVVRSTPVFGDGGQVRYAITTLRDITRRRKAMEWQRFLAEASTIFSVSLDYEKNLEGLAAAAVTSIADWCAVDLRTRDGGARRLALFCADPGRTAGARDLALGGPGAFAGASATGAGAIHVYPRISADMLAALERDPERLERLRALDIHSAMRIPLAVRGEIIGVVTLATAGPHARRYSRRDRELAGELARRASISIDNARLYEGAQEAVRSREDLLAIVSHDLRNPLGVVLTSSALLLKGSLSPEKEDRARRQVEAIQRAGNRMNRLIGDLLDFASIKGGQLSIVRRPHEARELVGDVLDSMEPLASKKGQHLVNQVPASDPNLNDLKVTCDRDRMVQVFANIVGNAMKFTPEGGTVTVRAEHRGSDVLFAVADDGPGMSPDELVNVFDRYWQAQRKNREGIGLGLSIVKGIIEAHGGRVWADSELGKGSTFYVALPAGNG